MMTAGFERHVGSRSTGFVARDSQRMHFGMRFSRALVPPLANDHTIANDDATDARIRRRGVQAAFGQAQSLCHVLVICGRKHAGGLARLSF